MKILMTNYALNHFYGTETWTYTVAKELTVLGHTVKIYSPNFGRMSQILADFCQVTSIPPIFDSRSDREYDLILVNHRDCLKYVDGVSGFKIFTTHGINSKQEIPSYFIKVDKIVAVSEETAKGIYPVIRNGIDCERFDFKSISENNPKTILYLSHPHYNKAFYQVCQACRELNLRFLSVGRDVFNIEKLIYKADLVISFGRGTLESLACGRNVISADFRPHYMNGFKGGGIITPENFDTLKKDNFTGRLSGQIDFNPDRLIEEIEKYSPEYSESLRQKVIEEFDIKNTVQQYLELME